MKNTPIKYFRRVNNNNNNNIIVIYVKNLSSSRFSYPFNEIEYIYILHSGI